MASSGSTSVAVTSHNTLTFSWSEVSQSVANNSTTINWYLKLSSDAYGTLNVYADKTYTVVVDGAEYSGTNKVTIGANKTITLASGTMTMGHHAEGNRSFSYSFTQTFAMTFSGTYIGSKSGTGSGTLNTIPRKSSLSVGNGTLGTSQTLTVTRQSTSFTHSIKYVCGSASGYIKADGSVSSSEVKHSDCSIPFTPPLTLASQNTTGTSVSVTYTIVTYNGSTSIGSTGYTKTCSIPSSVKPTCSITVSDATDYYSTYGYFIKGLSKLKVTVKPTLAYSSPISSYKTTANGSTYTSATFTTDVLKSSGTIKVSATVTDKRNRSGSNSTSVTVLDYSPPIISKLNVGRVDENGDDDEEGKYVEVLFSATVDDMDGKNTARYVLEYKKTSDSQYTSVALSDYDDNFAPIDGSYIFEAAIDSSYNVRLIVTDTINADNPTTSTTTASTAYTILDFNVSGDAIGVGKISEIPGVFDIGMQTRLNGGLLYPVLEPETDLNNILIPGMYTGENISNYNYANCPVSSGTFTLVVHSGGEDGQVCQIYTSCSKYKPERYVRWYYQGAWSNEWYWANTEEYVLYENEAGSSDTITLRAAANHYRYIEIYFTDNNGKTGGYTKVWNADGQKVCLHITEGASSVHSRQTIYTVSGTTMTPDITNASYVKFSGTSSSVVSGTNYIKIVRVIGRA